MKSKNEHISVWILEQERQKDKENLLKEIARKSMAEEAEAKNHCCKCKQTFAEPKLVQFYACPHCLSKIEDEAKTSCQHWLGFLSQKDSKESVPQECVECCKVLDCMLTQYQNSTSAVSQIKKWY